MKKIVTQIRDIHHIEKELQTNPKDNLKLFLEYLKLSKKHNLIDIHRIKYLGSNFLRGFKGASKSRAELMSLKSYEEIYNSTKELIKNLA